MDKIDKIKEDIIINYRKSYILDKYNNHFKYYKKFINLDDSGLSDVSKKSISFNIILELKEKFLFDDKIEKNIETFIKKYVNLIINKNEKNYKK